MPLSLIISSISYLCVPTYQLQWPFRCILQVWFQNARAKYRRNLLKQQSDNGKGGDSIKSDSQSLAEISNTHSPHSPSGLSDISSTPSLSELGSTTLEPDQNSSGSSLTELFSNSINAMNWPPSLWNCPHGLWYQYWVFSHRTVWSGHASYYNTWL